MPKRKELIKKIQNAAKASGMTFEQLRQGANHEIYSLDGLMIPVARHTEFDKFAAEEIYKECEPKLGKGWWR